MKEIIEQFATGQLTPVTIVLWSAVAFLLAVLGGVIGGMKMGGKDIGHDLAAMMGALFGPTAAVPAVFLGLLILAWLQG